MLELLVLQSLEQLISRAEQLLQAAAPDVPPAAPLTPALVSVLLLERVERAAVLLALLKTRFAQPGRGEAPALR